MKPIAHVHRLGSARGPNARLPSQEGESWRKDRLAAAHTAEPLRRDSQEDPPFNRLTATRKSRLPAHARTPIHKSIGHPATIPSPSIKTPIARSSIVRRVSHTSGTSRTGPARTERNAPRLWVDKTALSGRPSHPPPGRPLANKPDFQQTHATPNTSCTSAVGDSSLAPRRASQHSQHQHLAQPRTQAEPSQPEPDGGNASLPA
ncbi:hypothetical protein D9611_014212 [Ephemerocybe angulata]|uniref:Uncharacterized protein n=1 Tax=Ephemerocybe angulata TaxID=980116 RepID=A0A8H5FI60_9AGAR|nr:hypothetical protein D9611_014212 [Tulosesus angulatus]